MSKLETVRQASVLAMAKPRVRVIDLETGGNRPTDVCEIGWQDVILDDDAKWQVTEERGAILVNPGRPMSADTMAIHHILDSQVADAPYWKEIASSVLRPPGRVDALAAHRAAFEQRYCTPRFTGSTPWICTWKCALRVWPELPRFSNQMLRYQRMPKGLIHETGLPAHRAMPDAYVTAHHLRDLLNEFSIEQCLTWTRDPGLLPRVPAGTDRGKAWDRLSDEALRAFIQDRDVDIRFSAQTELARRGGHEKADSAEPAQSTLF